MISNTLTKREMIRVIKAEMPFKKGVDGMDIYKLKMYYIMALEKRAGLK